MHIVIIGNGIAGITAARHIRKTTDYRVTVISKETDHFFSRTALMYIYMGHLRYEHTKPYEDWFWPKNRIELWRGTVESIDFCQKILHLSADTYAVQHQPTWLEKITQTAFSASQTASASLRYDKLIIATGSVPRWLPEYPRGLAGVQGLYSFQDLASLQHNTQNIQKAVIVGGGLIGVELAEMLHTRNIHVTMLVREHSYWSNVLPQEESALVSQHIARRGIDLRFLAEVAAIDGKTRVETVQTKQGETIACQLVGLTIGVEPNVHFLKNTPLQLNRGVLVNEFLETNLPDVYAIGDCVEHRLPPEGRKAIEQIWYTGRIMGETVAQSIAGKRTAYKPGVFFNSAKFFDLEYQTYGDVPADCPESISSFYWQHPTKEVALRINYQKDNQAVTGFNALGLRLRQEVCERWIQAQTPLSFVIQHLQEAHFDPEFFERYEGLITATFL